MPPNLPSHKLIINKFNSMPFISLVINLFLPSSHHHTSKAHDHRLILVVLHNVIVLSNSATLHLPTALIFLRHLFRKLSARKSMPNHYTLPFSLFRNPILPFTMSFNYSTH